MPPPKITKDEAVTIASAEVTRRGWRVIAPHAIEEPRAWVVITNSEYFGGPRVSVDHQTGKVLGIATLPR